MTDARTKLFNKRTSRRSDQDNFSAGEKLWVSWIGSCPVVLQS
jgi:hypothetical protein